MNAETHDAGRRRSLWKTPALITALILGIPLLRSLFAGEWGWDIRAFLLIGAVGTLLFSIGLTLQMLIRKLGTPAYRAAVGLALLTVFLLVWGNFVQGADGVNPAAFGYFVVPVVGIIGAALARFQPKGMARALFVTASVQALVLVIALMMRNPQVTPWTAAVGRGFGGNAVNTLLFVASALLFRKAARGESAPGAVNPALHDPTVAPDH
jgi:hypothetical protein